MNEAGERRQAIYYGEDVPSVADCLGIAWREPDDEPGYWHFVADDEPRIMIYCHEDDLLLAATI